jgi:hypothetical protein
VLPDLVTSWLNWSAGTSAIADQSPAPLARISTLNPVKPSTAIGATQRSFRPASLFSATNFVGASTAPTAAPSVSVGVGVADSVGDADSVGIADSVGVGAASLSELDEFAQTIAASATIPIITIQTVLAEVDCFGFATGFGVNVAEGASTRGAVLADEIGTGGTEYRLALFLGVDFLAVDFFVARLAGVFLVAFFAVFLTALFFATDFFAVFFLAADFFTADFLTDDFFAVFFAVFLTATVTPWIVCCT